MKCFRGTINRKKKQRIYNKDGDYKTCKNEKVDRKGKKANNC